MPTIKGVFDGDYTFTATAATKQSGVLSLTISGISFDRKPYTMGNVGQNADNSIKVAVTAKSGTKTYWYNLSTDTWTSSEGDLSVEYGETVSITCSAGGEFTDAYGSYSTATSSAAVNSQYGLSFNVPDGNFTLNSYTYTITQSAHQTITVQNTSTDGQKSYTSNFTAYYGDSWTASIAAESGYEAGTLSGTNGIVKGAYTLSATAAQQMSGEITNDVILNVINTVFGKNTFIIDRKPYSDDNVGNDAANFPTITITGGSATKTYWYRLSDDTWVAFDSNTITATVGDQLTATLKVDNGNFVNAYTIHNSNSSTVSLTVQEDFTLRQETPSVAIDCTLKTFAFTITQSDHQTITVHNTTITGSNDYTSSFTAYWGDSWTASIAADANYNPGTLSATSGTVTAAVSVSATAATANTRTVTISPTQHQTITVKFSNGKTYTSSPTETVVCEEPYGVTFTVSVEADAGYIAGAVHVEEAS